MSIDSADSAEKLNIRKQLSEWFHSQARELPWRTDRSTYAVIVSEFMLQQTQVKTVLPYYERWMSRFPTVAVLASASQDDVLKHWEGLGYYRRAHNLHALAKEWVSKDQAPQSHDELIKLPGIGPYTAAAVASFVFNDAKPVVDGNVVRVLSRLYDIRKPFRNNADAVKQLYSLADDLLDPDHPGLHNEAMMELGALVCTPRKPKCEICPLKQECRTEDPEQSPNINRPKVTLKTVNRLWALRENTLLLYRYPESDQRLAGIYELPNLANISIAEKSLKIHSKKKRAIANERIEEIVYALKAGCRLGKVPQNHEWIAVGQLEAITLSGPHKRWIKEWANAQA